MNRIKSDFSFGGVIISYSGENVLSRLGLTQNQARIYLTLVQIGKAPIKSIAKTAQIPRESVYRTMPALERISIVEKCISTPTTYAAIPVENAVSILMKLRATEETALQQQVGKLLQIFKDRRTEDSNENEEPQFNLVKGMDAFNRHLSNSVRNALQSFEGTTTVEGFRYGMFKSGTDFITSIKKGVAFRHVVLAEQKDDTQIPLGDAKERRTQSWVVKYCPDLKLKMVLIDNREVFISTTPNMKEDFYLRSTSPCLVSMAHNYFEGLWKYNRVQPLAGSE